MSNKMQNIGKLVSGLKSNGVKNPSLLIDDFHAFENINPAMWSGKQ